MPSPKKTFHSLAEVISSILESPDPANTQLSPAMQTAYAVDYITFPQHNTRVLTHRTDDPVEVEDFLMLLLVTGARIQEIRHDSLALSGTQFDRMLKVAAGRIAAQMLRECLGLDAVKVKDRFGFAS